MNSPVRTAAPSALEILEQACEWRVLAILLSRPTAERRAELRCLATEVHDARLAAAAEEWCAHATEGSYLALLGPGGIVPARAVAYQPFMDPGALLSRLADYHHAFGFHPRAEEPADHIALLAELVSYLWLKEGYARESQQPEVATLTANLRQRLLIEHLTPVAAPLAEKLAQCGASEWALAARLLAERVPAVSTPVVAAGDDSPACDSCARLHS